MHDRYERMRCKTDKKIKGWDAGKIKKIKGIINISLYLYIFA